MRLLERQKFFGRHPGLCIYATRRVDFGVIDVRTVTLWKRSIAVEVGRLDCHGHNLLAIAISPYSKFVAAASEDGLECWKLEQRYRIMCIERTSDDVTVMLTSLVGTILALGSFSRGCQVLGLGNKT